MSTHDLIGRNDYPPETGQRVVMLFETIFENLKDSFRKIDQAHTPASVFSGSRDGVLLAEVFGECLIFLAESLPSELVSGSDGKYRILQWHCTDISVGPGLNPWLEPNVTFESGFLDYAMTREIPVFFAYRDMKDRNDPLQTLSNLGVTKIWFDDGGALLLSVSLLNDAKDLDVWNGPKAKLIHLFSEVLATPLRVGNDRSQLNLFYGACRDGSAAEANRIGRKIISSRVHLAWWAASRPGKPESHEPPTVSGDYDLLFANYLDAHRYSAGVSPIKSGEADTAVAVVNFTKMFLPEKKDGKCRLLLYASSSANAPEDSFLLSDTAILSQFAVGRSMIWLAYKAACLDSGEECVGECPFPREHKGLSEKHAGCLHLLHKNYGELQPPLENVLDPNSAYISWLRYLWVEVFYRARHLRENRSEKSEKELAELAKKYSYAVIKARSVFKEILAAQEMKDTDLKVDWRWLYLWFLDNALNSEELHGEYSVYDRQKHGFVSHLDHYRDTSTALLFGLHLVRFWDGAIALELWDLPELRPDEVMRARLRLLCEYAYREFGVDRAWQLEHHLGAQFQPEMILQVSSSAHREHVLHVMDVCLLGHLLLKSEDRGAASASKFRAKLLGGRPEKEFLRMWYPAALLHDLGRAHEIPLSMPDLLKHLDTSDLKIYSESVQEGVKKADKALDDAIIKQFGEAGLKIAEPMTDVSHDHGVISCHHLIHSLKGTTGDKSFLEDDDTKAILHAIVRHNRKCELIDAVNEPLSYFLVLCDHLQEWSRPRFPAHQLAMSFLGWTQVSSPFSVKGQKAARHMTPKAKYVKSENALIFDKGEIKLTLQCEPPRSSLFEPACLWVTMTADLERIFFKADYPTVDLEFSHPRSEAVSSSLRGAYEMELLRDFAKTEAGAFLSSWLNYVATGKEEMKYFIKEDASECYRLCLGTRLQGTARLLYSVSKKFYKQFVEWKRRQLQSADED